MTSRLKKPFVIDSSSQRSRMQEYEPIADEHLYNFFCSPGVRKTMVRGGLVTRKGEVIRRSANPRAPRLILPPLTLVSAPTQSSKPNLGSKHTATSTGRLNLPSESEPAPNRMGRKAESTSDLGRTREDRTHETAGKRPWEAGSLKPLSHEEYERLLQRFCEGAEQANKPEARVERKKSEDLARQQLREEAKKQDLPGKEGKRQEKDPRKADWKEQDGRSLKAKEPAEPPTKLPEAKVESKPAVTVIPQPKRSFSPIPEEKHDPPATPPKPETHLVSTPPALPHTPPKPSESTHPPDLPAESPPPVKPVQDSHPSAEEIASPVAEPGKDLHPQEDHKEQGTARTVPGAEGGHAQELKGEGSLHAIEQGSLPLDEKKAEGAKETEPPHYNAEVPVAP